MPDESGNDKNADDEEHEDGRGDRDDGCGADDGKNGSSLALETEHFENLNLHDKGEYGNANNVQAKNLELLGSDDSVDLLVPPDDIDQNDQDGQGHRQSAKPPRGPSRRCARHWSAKGPGRLGSRPGIVPPISQLRVSRRRTDAPVIGPQDAHEGTRRTLQI